MFHVLGYLCVTSLKITQYGLVLFWYIESLAVTKSIIFFVLSDLEHVIEFIFSRFLTFFLYESHYVNHFWRSADSNI